MRKILIVITLFFIYPLSTFALSVPSNNAILMDEDSGRILYSKNIDEKHLIASTTKIMTAIIAIESGKLDDIVTINDSVTKSHGSGIYVSVGEKISLRNLVYGLLLRSGNDAALAIEDYLGGHKKFIQMMNKKAQEIGMENTIFNNASGLDDEETGKKYTVKTNYKTYSWTNKNKLLFKYKYANGGKTGYTKKAKRTLVTSASKNDVNLIAVTFNDPDDFDTHEKLYEYGFTNYKNYMLINKDKINIKSDKYKNKLYVKNNYYYLMTNDERENININVIMYKKMDSKTNEVGYLDVYYKDENIHKEPIYVKVK